LVTSPELFATTALIAVMSAVVAVLLGYPIGHWLASLRRTKRLVTSVLVLPFLLPAFLVGLAIRPILGDALDDSLVAVVALIFAHVLMNAGFIAVVTAASMTPRDQAEAAALDGATRRQIRWHLQLPQQLPALGAAALLVALYSATSFGLVITLGQGSIRTLETEIVSAALQRLDLPTAGLLAVLQSVLTLSFFVVAKRLGATPTALFGEGEEVVSRSRSGMVLGVGLIVVILWVIGGVLEKAVNSGPGLWGNLVNLTGRGTRDILNLSVLEAAGNSVRNMVVAVAISLVLAWWLSKRRAGLLVLFPIGISPVVIGLAALVFSGYLPPVIAGSWLVLPVVQSIFLTPLAFQIISPARRSLSPDIVEAATLDGASGLRLFGLIELPSMAKPVLVAAALVSLGSLGEFGAASFLTYGSNQTLPLVMFRLMSRPGAENLGMAMSAAALFIVLALVVVWVISSVPTERTSGRSHGAPA
jgi:thiamine transport system permease protein